MTSKINNPSTGLEPNSKPGFFVTGTDTEVGKTLVSGALLLLLSKNMLWLAAINQLSQD